MCFLLIEFIRFLILQVTGFFITEGEHPLGGEVIAKALKVFRDWNPGYAPEYCMADCDQAEANALSEVFPDSPLFWCDFHVKKAWKERFRGMFKAINLDFGRVIGKISTHEHTTY